METRLVAAEAPAAIPDAVAELRAGHPVALPTETVYGLAAEALRVEAVATIFEAKARPFFDPLIVHLSSLDDLERLAAIPAASRELVDALVAAFWPGPLTLVLPRRAVVPDLVTAGLETVAVRMSAHPVFRAVLAAFGGPLAAPSANRFGRISPTTAAHVHSELAGRIPLILDGGATEHGLESTIVKIDGGRASILRAGPVTIEQLAAFGEIGFAESAASATPEAPGQLASHYAPTTPLVLLEPGARFLGQPAGSGFLTWRNDDLARASGCACCEILSPRGDLREAAANLFASLRRLDEAGLALIVAEAVPERGLGFAIMDRLRKAARQSS